MPMVMVDLRADAAAEACRVARARTLLHDDDACVLAQLEAGGAWIARARRTPTRQALGGRFLLLWRIAVEDVGGRLVESAIIPVVVDVTRNARRPLTRSRLKVLVATLARETQPRVEDTSAEWQHAADRTVCRFASTRIARERAVANRIATSVLDTRAYQPGLFDRRVERERRGDAAAATDAEHATAERLLSAGQLAAVQPRPPQLLLVLVP